MITSRSAGARQLEGVLLKSRDFIDAATRLRNDTTLDSAVRRAALDLLSERCRLARSKPAHLEHNRLERLWILRVLGREPWPDQKQAEADLLLEPDLPSDANSLNGKAWELVDPDAPPQYGEEPRALALARRAVALSAIDPAQVAPCRDTLARALLRVGRFDQALVEQRQAMADAPADQKAAYQKYLQRLEADIAVWRDESGSLRIAEWNKKLEDLNREIASLEQDSDVRMWIATSARLK